MILDRREQNRKELGSELDIIKEIKMLTDAFQFKESVLKMKMILNVMKDFPQTIQTIKEEAQKTGVERVDFPPDGGVLTVLRGHNKPYHGFPHHEEVQDLDRCKKIIKDILQNFGKEYPGWRKLLLLPQIFGIIKTIEILFYGLHIRLLKPIRLRPRMYSICVREVYRIFNQEIEREKDSKKKLKTEAERDILCLLLEYDNAYRFRFQDILFELKKERLEKEFLSEIGRLFDILIKRERWAVVKKHKFLWFSWMTYRSTKTKMFFLKWMVLIGLFLNKYYQEKIKRMLLEVNLNEIKLTDDDKEFCRGREDYNFGFTKNEDYNLYESRIIESEIEGR